MGNFVVPVLRDGRATYKKFVEKIGQSLSAFDVFLRLRYIASFRNQSALKSTGSKIEAKFRAFLPLIKLGEGERGVSVLTVINVVTV